MAEGVIRRVSDGVGIVSVIDRIFRQNDLGLSVEGVEYDVTGKDRVMRLRVIVSDVPGWEESEFRSPPLTDEFTVRESECGQYRDSHLAKMLLARCRPLVERVRGEWIDPRSPSAAFKKLVRKASRLHDLQMQEMQGGG